MRNAKELFQRAYNLYVVEENDNKAATICRKIIEINPDHYNARLLLGIILAQKGSSEESSEAKSHFIEAVKRVPKIQNCFIDKWEEEDPIYQLALSEIDEKKMCSALLLLLVDFFFAQGDHSGEVLFNLLDKVESEHIDFFKHILKTLKKEYKITPI